MHERLRSEILAGATAPGAHLSVPSIAKRLGVSRTPVREALFRLEQDGLVRSLPHRGVVVLTPDPADLRELFEVREALEGMAARVAATHALPGEITGLRAHLERHAQVVRDGDRDAHVRMDLEFHEQIRAAGRNERLTRSLDQLSDQIALAIRANAARPWSVEQALQEHRAIVDALDAGDPDAAEAAARAHIRRVRETMLQAAAEPAGSVE